MSPNTEQNTAGRSGAALPSVRPEVVAEVVAALSPRLQKRLDGAAAKLTGRPVSREGDDWLIDVDEDVRLVLHAPGGVIRTAADVGCGCLLAPACLHRAAAVTAAPLADPAAEEPGTPGTAAGADAAGNDAAGVDAAGAETPEAAGTPAGLAGAAESPAAESPAGERPAGEPGSAPLTPAESAAAQRLHASAAAALAAGVSGAGGVLQAELLRAAHQARLSGLHRPAAAAVAVATRLRAARTGEPDHRLADLTAALRDLLDLATALGAPAAGALDPVTLAGLRGTARQAYQEAGGLRLYGLFAEPVLTATHAGVLSWAVDASGRLSTVAEITPHTDAATAAPQALAAGGRAVRLGDTMLSHREFTRAGLSVQGATRSASGRLGAGAKVRAVRAAGAAWTAEPLARLWAEPLDAQIARALAWAALPYDSRPAGGDLLFLDVTLAGTAAHGDTAAPQLLARCEGLTVALRPAHDHPGLAHRANLALLAARPGLRLRVIGRLERAARPELRLLAVGPAVPEHPSGGDEAQKGDEAPGADVTLALAADRAGRINLGLERLQRADLPAGSGPDDGPDAVPASLPELLLDLPGPSGTGSAAVEAPVHLLTRRVEQAVTGGRRALGAAASGAVRDSGAVDGRHLRAAGLATAALLLDGLRESATDQGRDVFGRIVGDDHRAYTAAWLAASCYGEELATALCAAAWSPPDGR
ncbi:hypothetical protein GCM10010495_00820 [Kitasatospora herbaricolor]|uniref:hypothetical protein n=1 Tax=Kitasatospora herbaricolor TaxID=68217 RepID=UPI00174D8F55|nr:hypothetical protein [Kitasatospora herbaricolor]MDQ0311557.1 hypothetical protein [Kitasatospora herbaricolor]GGU95146.1 hypothetical protein GCM10010495_00820 [Kitasatospora herbaricolor]